MSPVFHRDGCGRKRNVHEREGMMQAHTGTLATTEMPRTAWEFLVALLQATLNARKIQAIVAHQWDGPQVRVFRCSLGLGEDPRQVERLAGALAQAAGAAEARISRGQDCLWIKIPKPGGERQILQPSRLARFKPPTPLHVPLGVGINGQAVWFNLDDPRHAHLVIGGTTGSGKTVALHWLLACLLRQNTPDQLRIILCDPKAGELAAFRKSAHLLHPVESRPGEIAKLLEWARAEMDERAQRGRTAPSTGVSRAQTSASPSAPLRTGSVEPSRGSGHHWRLLVIIDEVRDLIMADKRIKPALAAIAQKGRSCGVHVVVTMQQPSARALGEALVNFSARLLGRVATATLTYGAAGRPRTMAETLLGNGDFILLAAGRQVRLQVLLIRPAHITRLPQVEEVPRLELGEYVDLGVLAKDTRGSWIRKELDWRMVKENLASDGATPAAGPEDIWDGQILDEEPFD